MSIQGCKLHLARTAACVAALRGLACFLAVHWSHIICCAQNAVALFVLLKLKLVHCLVFQNSSQLSNAFHLLPSRLLSCIAFLTAQALELEDLPEDDDEDIDFTLEGLLGPLESDLDEDMAEVVVEAPRTHGKVAVKRPRRHAGTQDPSRCGDIYLYYIYIYNVVAILTHPHYIVLALPGTWKGIEGMTCCNL